MSNPGPKGPLVSINDNNFRDVGQLGLDIYILNIDCLWCVDDNKSFRMTWDLKVKVKNTEILSVWLVKHFLMEGFHIENTDYQWCVDDNKSFQIPDKTLVYKTLVYKVMVKNISFYAIFIQVQIFAMGPLWTDSILVFFSINIFKKLIQGYDQSV